METQQVSKLKKVGLACVLACVTATVCAAPLSDRDKAKRIHDRIAGVPPTEAVLDQMEALVTAGNQDCKTDLLEFRDLCVHLCHPRPI